MLAVSLMIVFFGCFLGCNKKFLWWLKLVSWVSWDSAILVVIMLPSVLSGSRLGPKGVLFFLTTEKIFSSAALECGIVSTRCSILLR